MEHLDTNPTPFRDAIRRHKVAIAVVSTCIIAGALNRLSLKQHDAFLAEKGLLDEFYHSEE